MWKSTNSSTPNTFTYSINYNAVRLIVTRPFSGDFLCLDADRLQTLKLELDRGESKTAWDEISLDGLYGLGLKKSISSKLILINLL